ncbi:MAG: hypothetical protein V1740_00110 [Candidatus Woesearchaeota archaeon]
MAIPPVLTMILLKLLVSVVLTIINAVILREIVVFFNVKDETMTTATAIAIWIGGVFFVFSFLGEVRIIGLVIFTLINIFLIYLIKRYYFESIKQSLLIWETWASIFLYLTIFMYSLSATYYALIIWGLIPLAINFSFIIFMKMFRQSIVTHVASIIIGFLVINIIWIALFMEIFPVL